MLMCYSLNVYLSTPSLPFIFVLLMYSSLVAFVLSLLAFPSSVIPSHLISLPTPGQVVATTRCPPIFNCCRRRALISTVCYCDAVPGRVHIIFNF